MGRFLEFRHFYCYKQERLSIIKICFAPAPGTKDAASATPDGKDFYLGGDPLLQSLHMGNDADEFSSLLQAGQGTQCRIQGILIQRAETFIKEQ